jgi:2-oxoacid dehydrogenases acyltransferase (catalytic domain)
VGNSLSARTIQGEKLGEDTTAGKIEESAGRWRRGKFTARERIGLLLDPGTLVDRYQVHRSYNFGSAEAIVKRPVVADDAIAIRGMMKVGSSFDHRIQDGGAALRFLNADKKRLEDVDPGTSLG